MDENIQKLGEIIKNAQKILVTTHKNPDSDAWTSLSITAIALKRYLGKENVEVRVSGNDRESDLTKEYEKLHGVKLIPEDGAVDLTEFDLIIMTDSHQVKRCFRNFENLSPETLLIGIDHHEFEKEDSDKLILNFNEFRSSAAEESYRVFRDLIGQRFIEDKEIAVLAQKGIISDTARFLYGSTKPETYELMSELTKTKQLDTETYTLESGRLDETAIKGLSLYLGNYVSDGNMAYSVVSAKEFRDAGVSEQGKEDAGLFVIHNIIKNVKGIDWGFIMRESFGSPGDWRISFRANPDTTEVVEIAKLLNGGGHKRAAGGRVLAGSKEEAIQIVLDAVKKSEE